MSADTITSARRPSVARHPILLVRHASTAWTGIRWCGRADPPLNPAGRREAADLAAVLVAELPSTAAVRTSPAQRARSTAAAIAASAGLDLVVDQDLVEVDVGAADGLTWDELDARFPETAARVIAGEPVDWPNGERHEALLARLERAATRITRIAGSRPIVVVSHGYVLDLLVRQLEGAANPRADDPPRARSPLGPAGVHRIPGATR